MCVPGGPAALDGGEDDLRVEGVDRGQQATRGGCHVDPLPRALAEADWSLDDLALLEINEAFAVQVLACVRVLASDELMQAHAGWTEALGAVDEEVLNVNGGAIALGHPVGVSGARLVLTLAREMRRRRAGRGAASLCVGGGQGQAILLEAS